MTKKELEQIYYIDREIKMWDKVLKDIKEQSAIGGYHITNVTERKIESSKVENIDIQIEEAESKIKKLLEKLYKQQQSILDYIDSIGDSMIRQIIFLRCISQLSWNAVADEVGGGNTEDSVRMRFNRFLKTLNVG